MAEVDYGDEMAVIMDIVDKISTISKIHSYNFFITIKLPF